MRKPEDVNDKDKWVIYGEEKEKEFVKNIAPYMDMGIRINPEKKNNPYAIDLVMENDKLADLKYQNEPFFLSKKMYGIEPNNCFTFDTIDYERYSEYDELYIIFWIEREYKYKYGVGVDGKNGVWIMDFEDIKNGIENDKYPKHTYKNRTKDSPNCTSCFLLKIEDMDRII